MYEAYQNTPKFTPIILIAKDKKNNIVGCLMSVIQQDYKGIIGEFTARSIVMGGALAENNNSVFDFGGAGKPNVPYGVRNYKLKFGGELVNYGRYQKEHKKLLMLIGRIALNLFKKIKR